MENSLESIINTISPFVEKGKWTMRVPVKLQDHVHMTIGCIVFKTKDEAEVLAAGQCILELERLFKQHQATLTSKEGKVVMLGPKNDIPAIPVEIVGSLGPVFRAWHESWVKQGLVMSEVPEAERKEKGTIFLHVTAKSGAQELTDLLLKGIKVSAVQIKPLGPQDPFMEIRV